MNRHEQELHYPLGDRLPEPGRAIEVAPGVKWLRMPLPFALDHINLWLLRDETDGPDGAGSRVQGWTVVDCGIDQPRTRELWEQVFADELEGLPVLRVVVTHMHPDHIGLAHWLCERWQTRMWISATDFHAARVASHSTTGFGGEDSARHFMSHGLADPQAIAQVRARSGYYPSLVPEVPHRYRRLNDGLAFDVGTHRWRCIAGYGHAPEHMSLYCEALGVLISGDMILPRISTNVSVYDVEPESDPLTLFLQSIDAFAPLPAGTLVLPSHGKPFSGLHARIRQLHDHHSERLADVTQACAQRACSAMDILPVMFRRPLDLHQTTFALGEVIAHLHALWYRGMLRRERDAQGVWRFSLVAGAA